MKKKIQNNKFKNYNNLLNYYKLNKNHKLKFKIFKRKFSILLQN